MTISKISKEAFKSIKKLSKKEIFGICKTAVGLGMMEEAFLPAIQPVSIDKQYTEDDFFCSERWVNEYVTNWATLSVCNHTVGTFLEMYPLYIEKLKDGRNCQIDGLGGRQGSYRLSYQPKRVYLKMIYLKLPTAYCWIRMISCEKGYN